MKQDEFRMHNIVDHLLGQEWSKKKISEKKFDEMFNIDGIPLSWFYRRLLVSHIIPKKFRITYLLNKLTSNKKISISEKIKFTFLNLFYRKALWLNENIKLNLAKRSHPINREKKKHALFLIPSNHFNSRNDSAFRVNTIVEKLGSKNIEPIQLVFDPLSMRSYKKIIDSKKTIYDFVDHKTIKKAKKKSNELYKNWKDVTEKEKLIFFSYKESSLWPYFKYTLNFFFSREFLFYQCLYYEALHKVVKQELVESVILTSQNSIFEKALLAVAKLHDIPVVLVQHGLGEGVVNPDIFQNTKIAVFGGMSKKRLLKVGISENNITVVGPIIFDEISRYKKLKKEEPKKEKNEIMIITEPFVESNRVSKNKYFTYIKKIIREINTIDKVNVTIKLHPSEKGLETYKKIVKEMSYNNVKVTQKVGSSYLYQSIIESDLVIEFGSTVAVEAMILDVPVITTNFCPISGGNYDLIQQCEGTYKVDHREDISKKITDILGNDSLKEQRKKAIEYMCGDIDGKASERITEIIRGNFRK